jgi:hypothetical protein
VSVSVPCAGPSGRVAIAGDWHGNLPWVHSAIPRLHRQAPDVTTIFHLGDLELFPGPVGAEFPESVDHLPATAGKNEGGHPGQSRALGDLAHRFSAHPSKAVQLRRVVWVLPNVRRSACHGWKNCSSDRV